MSVTGSKNLIKKKLSEPILKDSLQHQLHRRLFLNLFITNPLNGNIEILKIVQLK
jgi:hypothetical protein